MDTNNEYNYDLKYIIYWIFGMGLVIFAYFYSTQDEITTQKEAVVKSSTKTKHSTKNTQEKNTQEKNKPKQAIKNIKEKNKEPNSKVVKKQTPPSKNAKMVKDFAKCYNLGEGSYIINYQCKKNIIAYVNKHKDAKYFEIIGIVDNSEFKLYKNLENHKILYDVLGVTPASVKLMKKLTNSGLAKHRAIEASWIIKANTNQTAITYNPHYHITSTEGKKGMLVRAYK